MIKLFTKKSNTYLSIIIITFIFFSLFNLFLGNENLNEIDSLEELLSNQEINCNQHYLTLKNKINELSDSHFDVSVVHKDIYIFPEIENILCLGKSIEIVNDGNSIYIISGTNQKVFKYLCAMVLILFILLFHFLKNEKIFLFLLMINTLLVVQLYLFSSFKNPLVNFINLVFFFTITIITVESLKNPKHQKIHLIIVTSFIVVSSIFLLKYIYFDYIVYLSIFGLLFLKSLQKILNLKNLDIGYIICISHIGLILGGVDYPLSRNHINYFPSIFYDIDSNNFGSHYSKDITYPYPFFKWLTTLIINLFGIESVNFLNYFSYYFGLLIIFVFIKYMFTNNWLKICLFLTVILGRLSVYSLFKDSGWDRNVYQNSILKSGIGEAQLLSHLFQPTTFDVVVLLVIVFLLNKNFKAANITAFFTILLHTYNVLPIFLIYTSYILTGKKSLKDCLEKFKNAFLLIMSLPIIYLTNIAPLASTTQEVLEADKIMTNLRIPLHRLFSGNFSILGRSNYEIVINLFENSFNKGFHLELEYIFITLFLLVLIKNLLIKNLTVIIFITTVSTIFFTYLYKDSIISAQIRNIVPWRASSIIYLLGVIYIINQFTKNSVGKKIDYFVSSFILIIIIFLSASGDIDDTRLRRNINQNEILYSGRNLINPNDDYIIFSNSNIDGQNSYFISTTHNYYGHPYKSSEIIEWYESINYINTYFNSTLSCENFSELIDLTDSKRAIFSSEEYIPKSIIGCKNLKKEHIFGYYLFEQN